MTSWKTLVPREWTRSLARTAHERDDIEDQRHAAVAHDGGARHVLHLAVVGFEVLDHDLLLAEQFIHQQGDAAAFGLDHHHYGTHVLEVEARHVEHLFEFDHRHVLVAHLH